MSHLKTPAGSCGLTVNTLRALAGSSASQPERWSPQQPDLLEALVLMAFMGHEALDQFPAWGITDAMKKDYKLLIAQIDKQVSPKDFPISRRLMFRHRKRKENEDIDDYIIELLKLSEGCEFEDKEQEHMIIDNLVDSITDTALQQFIIRKNHTDYKELVSAIKESEKLNEVSQAIAIKNGNGSSIHHLKYSTSRAESRAPSKSSYQSRSSKYKPYKNDSRSRRHKSNHHRSRSKSVSFAPSRSQSRSMSRSKSKSRSRSRSHSHHRSKTRKPTPGPDNVRKRPCQRCDSRHKFGECPAEGYQCKKCNYFGHFTRCCKTSLKKGDSLIVTKRIETTPEKNTEPDDYVLIHSILTKSAEPEWYEEIRVKTKRIRFKLDPGSDIDTLPMSYLKMLNMKVEDLSKPETRALLYGKVEISILGKITLPITCRDKSGELTFYVIEAQDVPLLSRHTCVALNLVQRIPPSVHSIKTHNNEIPDITKEISDENIRKFVESNIDVFTGTGQFPDTVS
ncbi:Glutamine-rich protein 2 [Frankliniella fusca]|uniref:Glutamine-rich protein 2 n=1 Tax=Frankliniella fusca TaxID=407009 RepID=A0AAE1LB09_9NEOP|nr:Glutamine-rich protein 2 [Frankliniella fusca]